MSVIVKALMEIVSIAQVDVGADKKFSTEIIAGGAMKIEGTYTIKVQYGTENRSATTSFDFGGTTNSGTVVQTPDESGVSR